MTVLIFKTRAMQRAHRQELDRKRDRETNYKLPPSHQMQGWQDYERDLHGASGRGGPPESWGYNLYTDTVRSVGSAYELLTEDPKVMRRITGLIPKNFPRRALATLSRAFGYRYLRGIEVIACELEFGATGKKFREERADFRKRFEQAADAAHTINDKGQNPHAALEVVMMFFEELTALCRWFELVGNKVDADALMRGINFYLNAPRTNAA